MSKPAIPPDERAFPLWLDTIAIDPDGSVWGFEGEAYFEDNQWHAPDDGNPKRYQCLGFLRVQLTKEEAKALLFRRVEAG